MFFLKKSLLSFSFLGPSSYLFVRRDNTEEERRDEEEVKKRAYMKQHMYCAASFF
uniref:Antixoidant peptide n=1 Tax=Odorrana andersonii TaxID=369514 RepID=K7XFG3_ODOAN|nr:antixoidant peptide precursor [Odorrana andersonii]